MNEEVRSMNFVGNKCELVVKEFISSVQTEKVLILDLTLKAQSKMKPKRYISIEVTLTYPDSMTVI